MIPQEKPEPLPLTYYTIYEALDMLLPSHSMLILRSIRRIVAISREHGMPGFSTIGITKDGTLIVDMNFWDEYIIGLDELQTLLYHELLHGVSGDIYLLREGNSPDDKLRNMCDNIAMDSRNNAFICRTRPDINPHKLMEASFSDELCEKHPTMNLSRPNRSKFIPTPEMRKEYDAFYKSDELCSHERLAELLYEYYKSQNNGEEQAEEVYIKLLGGHGDGDGQGDPIPDGAKVIEITMEELEEAKKNLIDSREAKKGKTETTEKNLGKHEVNGSAKDTIKEAVLETLAEMSGGGCGPGGKLYTQLLDRCLHITEKFDLAQFKKLAFNSIFHNVRAQARKETDRYKTLPFIPKKPTVTDTLLLAAGCNPVLFRHRKKAYTFDKSLLPIYLDVSGSTMPYIDEIIRLIANVSKELDYVWGFSTYVVEHTTKQLEEGKIVSSGGTDFNVVLDHAIEKKFEHIVVITDGEGYARFNSKIPSIKSVVTILFGSAAKNNYFSKYYENTHMIDEVKI